MQTPNPNAETALLRAAMGSHAGQFRPDDMNLLADMLRARRTRYARNDRVPRRPAWLAEGWACQMLNLGDGRRQIIEFLIPGDFIGLTPGATAIDVRPLTRITLVDASALAPGSPGARLEEALAAAVSEQRARLEQRILSLGRRTAIERLSYLLLELVDRVSRHGLATDHTIGLPVTQEALGDALGLSIVHVNRTLQELRRTNAIKFANGRLTILDVPRMEELAESKPFSAAAAD